MIPNEKIQEYKTKLESEKRRLVGEIEKEEKPENFGDDIDSGEEEAKEAEELGNRLADAGALRERVAEIDSALARIEARTYGVCTGCGKEISEEMLDVVPESSLCAGCKSRDAR